MFGSDLLQVVLSGIALGGTYTLLALGMFVTYAASRAMNFGQGDFLAVAAFLGMAAMTIGISGAVAFVGVCAAVAALAMAVERIAIRPLERRGDGESLNVGWILTTLGFGLMLQNVITIVWGKSRYYSPPLFTSKNLAPLHVFGAALQVDELIVAAVSLAAVAGFYFALNRTNWGRNLAAVSFDPATASLLGIDVRRTITIAYAIMGAATAAGGVLVGPLGTVQSHMGPLFLVKSFSVVAVGGLVNPLGVLIAGFGFGVVEALSNFFDSTFGDLYPFLIVFGCLIVWPTGLFKKRLSDVR
jgi:branched-chain amino acid transport system permease protein